MLDGLDWRNQNFCETNLFDDLFAFLGGKTNLHVPNLDSFNVLCVIETDIVMSDIVSITVYENVRSPPKVDGVVGSKCAPVC